MLATSDERRATSDERRATSDERRATSNEQSFARVSANFATAADGSSGLALLSPSLSKLAFQQRNEAHYGSAFLFPHPFSRASGSFCTTQLTNTTKGKLIHDKNVL